MPKLKRQHRNRTDLHVARPVLEVHIDVGVQGISVLSIAFSRSESCPFDSFMKMYCSFRRQAYNVMPCTIYVQMFEEFDAAKVGWPFRDCCVFGAHSTNLYRI